MIPSLDKSAFEKKANLAFIKAIKEVTVEIDDKLNDIVNPYSHDLKLISEIDRNFNLKTDEITKFISNNIAILNNGAI